MTPSELLAQGMTIAFGFFALGLLVVFIVLVLERIVGFVRSLLG